MIEMNQWRKESKCRKKMYWNNQICLPFNREITFTSFSPYLGCVTITWLSAAISRFRWLWHDLDVSIGADHQLPQGLQHPPGVDVVAHRCVGCVHSLLGSAFSKRIEYTRYWRLDTIYSSRYWKIRYLGIRQLPDMLSYSLRRAAINWTSYATVA